LSDTMPWLSSGALELEPPNSEYAERIAKSFESQQVMKLIGARIGAIGPGTLELRLPFREDLTQQHGRLHGGIVALMLDNVCAGAALTMFPPDMAVLCAEYKVSFLDSAVGTELVSRGRIVKRGRTLTTAIGEAAMYGADGKARLVAISQSTLVCVPATEKLPAG
jgi:uncharacterized protein (TIGR00369 family)